MAGTLDGMHMPLGALEEGRRRVIFAKEQYRNGTLN